MQLGYRERHLRTGRHEVELVDHQCHVVRPGDASSRRGQEARNAIVDLVWQAGDVMLPPPLRRLGQSAPRHTWYPDSWAKHGGCVRGENWTFSAERESSRETREAWPFFFCGSPVPRGLELLPFF